MLNLEISSLSTSQVMWCRFNAFCVWQFKGRNKSCKDDLEKQYNLNKKYGYATPQYLIITIYS
jgi:hypothetical protein